MLQKKTLAHVGQTTPVLWESLRQRTDATVSKHGTGNTYLTRSNGGRTHMQ